MPVTRNKQNLRDGLDRAAAAARYPRRISVVAVTGIMAIMAAVLLASAPYTRPAQAIDANLGGTNASLVFNPTYLGLNQFGVMCAFNLNQTTSVTVEFVFDSVTFGDHLTQSAQLSPRNEACYNHGGVANLEDSIIASIVLKAPIECSQAADYPGKCRVIGSIEVADPQPGISPPYPGWTNRIHLDPVLVPGLPGNSRSSNTPQ
jgi:hypothetical protein